MTQDVRIAVLMTCFNRRELTLGCLETLRGQAFFREEDLFLVDDGSSDGTGAAVLGAMPKANVVQGDGSLFWNGGMRLAWDSAKAHPQHFDYYLWLNDDVRLADDAFAMLVADAETVVPCGGAVIVAAATSEPGQATITYGAHRQPNPARPLRIRMIEPEGKPIEADTVSGNIVLVSDAAERKLGNMWAGFEHIYGDLDYGLRAKAAGIPVMLASRVGGTCAANPIAGSSLDRSMGKWARLRRRWVESGKVHARDWRRFMDLHGKSDPVSRIAYRAAPYINILLDR